MSKHLQYPDTQAIPEDLNADRQKDKCGKALQNAGAGFAEQSHQSGRVAVTDHDQQADEKHARCRSDKVAKITVFKSRPT